MTWSAGVAGWIAFGVSAGITVIAGLSAVLTDRNGRKLGHGLVALVALVALWSLVAALAFSGTLLTWLVFADAIAVGVLALADLTAHEATTEKSSTSSSCTTVPSPRAPSSAPPPDPSGPRA